MNDREAFSGNRLDRLDVLGIPMRLELSGSESRFASDEEKGNAVDREMRRGGDQGRPERSFILRFLDP